MITPYEYIGVMFLSLLGVLVIMIFIKEVFWRHIEKKEDIKRKELLDACIGKSNHEDENGRS